MQSYNVRSFSAVADATVLAALQGGLDLPGGFGIVLTSATEEVDSFGHVNHTVYARWMEACAWAHSAHVGLSQTRCCGLNRGMVMGSLKVEYLAAAGASQTVVVMNWITAVNRLRAERRFQVFDLERSTVLARGHAHYVCVDLSSGAPVRMPAEFQQGYVVS